MKARIREEATPSPLLLLPRRQQPDESERTDDEDVRGHEKARKSAAGEREREKKAFDNRQRGEKKTKMELLAPIVSPRGDSAELKHPRPNAIFGI